MSGARLTGDTTPAPDAEPIGTSKTTTIVETPVLPEEDPQTDVAEILGALGTSPVRIQVSRRSREGGEQFMGGMAMDEFSVEAVAERWGGGKYRIQARDGSNKYIKGGSAVFEIGGPSRDPRWSDDDSGGVPAGVLAGAGVTAIELAKFLADARNPPAAAAQGNPVDMAVALVTAIQAATAPMMTALLEQRSGGGAVKTADLLALMREGITLGREAGTSGDGNYLDVVRQALPMIGTALGGSPPAAQPPGDVAPSPNLQAPAPVPGWVTAISPYVQNLQPTAEAGGDPELYSRVVADQATPAVVAFVREQLDRGPAFLADFYAYFPQTVPARPWWDEFFPLLAGELTRHPDHHVERAMIVADQGREIVPVAPPVEYVAGQPAPSPGQRAP